VAWMMAPNADTLCPPLLSNCVRHDLHALTIPSASSRTARSRRRRLHPGTTAGREPSGGSNCGRGRRRRARTVQRPHTAALSRHRRRAPSLAGERLAAPTFFPTARFRSRGERRKTTQGRAISPRPTSAWPLGHIGHAGLAHLGPPFFLSFFSPSPTGIAAGPAHFFKSAWPSFSRPFQPFDFFL
jgi:hypothetical protein